MSLESMLQRIHVSVYKNSVLTVTGLIALWTLFAINFDSNFDNCAVESHTYKKDKYFMKISTYLFYSTVVMLILFLGQILVWQQPSQHRKSKIPIPSLQNAFSVSVTLLWYVITFLICQLGKVYLQDHNCASHPNSISGHYAFHIYYLLALPHLYLTIAQSEFTLAKRVVNKPHKADKEKSKLQPQNKAGRKYQLKVTRNSLLLITYIIFAITTMGTLSRTWIFGFHTLRQILYGTVLATLSHYIVVVLQAIALQDRKGPFILTTTITLGLLIFGYLTVHYGVFPLSSLEIYLGAATWAVTVYYSWYKYNKEKPQ